MNIEEFWKLIESSRSGFDPDRSDGNMERQRSTFVACARCDGRRRVLAYVTARQGVWSAWA